MVYIKQGGWLCGRNSRFNKREELSYDGYKDPDYMMLMMTTYWTLENLEGLDTQHIYKGAGG